MKEIIIIFILLLILLYWKQHYIEGFISSEKKINFQIEENETLKYIMKSYSSISKNSEKQLKNMLQTIKFDESSKYQNSNLIDLMLLVFLKKNKKKISKNELKNIMYQYLGPYYLIDNSKDRLYKKTSNKYVTVQIPISILKRVNWLLYDHIFKKYSKNGYIEIKDILNIKNDIITQIFINENLPLLRSPYVYDYNTQNYGYNYINLMKNKKVNNYIDKNSKNFYQKFNYNLTTDTLINMYNKLLIKKNNGNIIYQHFYKNEEILFDIIAGNLYVPTEKHFEEIIKKVKEEITKKVKEKNKNINPNNNYYQSTYYLASIENYPLRLQLPLNNNCQRVWYNCHDKDRINDYYNYYGYYKKYNLPIKTSKNSQVRFIPMQKKNA